MNFKLTVATSLPVLVAFGMANSPATASDPPDRSYEIGVQAYIYAFPMLLMEMTRRVSTNVEAPSVRIWGSRGSGLFGVVPSAADQRQASRCC